MTILGAIIQPDRAVLWCDTEVYRDHRPIGEGSKMALSGIGIGIVGSGAMYLIRQAGRSALASGSIDKVERRLAAELRISAAKMAPSLVLRNECWCTGQIIVAAGFSPTAGRMIGWKFGGAALFEPVLVGRCAAPVDAAIETDIRQVKSMGDIVALARRQIELVRQHIPSATGGSLTIAEMTETAMRCVKIPDFDVSTVSCRELVPPHVG